MRNKATSPDDFIMTAVRLKEGVRLRLKLEADKNKRSMMGEMAHRLEQSLPPVRKSSRKLEAAE